VFHKENALAYVIIGDIEENVRGLSPAIKHLRFIQTLTNIVLVAIENQRLYQDSLRQEALKKELELASKMQGMLIPDNKSLPKDSSFIFSTFYLPHLEVGGDFLDIIQLSEDEIGFCVADVSGKGIAAAILMSNFQASLRALFTKEVGLHDLIIKLNDIVNRNAKGEKFLTLFLGRYDKRTRNLEYVNSAHLPPLLYCGDTKKLEELESGCIGLGMLDEIYDIKLGNIKIEKNSKILCFTDGLTELKFGGTVKDDFLQLESYLTNVDTIDVNIEQIVGQLNAIKADNLIFDDITILGIHFL
jgi:phosphoserine phosphatase RsbU/P